MHQDQPPPTNNDGPSVWDIVIADMKARDTLGRERYSTPVQPFNGRNSLRDAYEEVLDLSVYLRQAMIEHGADKQPKTCDNPDDTAILGGLRDLHASIRMFRDDVAALRDRLREQSHLRVFASELINDVLVKHRSLVG